MMKPFSKPYLTVPAQIALLKARGLTITDDGRATAALERIGYYRLSGYWYPLRTSTGTGTSRAPARASRLRAVG